MESEIKKEIRELAEVYGIKDEDFLLALEDMVSKYDKTFKGLVDHEK